MAKNQFNVLPTNFILLLVSTIYSITISEANTIVENSRKQIVENTHIYQCNGETKLDVLPGRGWDNIRNMDMRQITSFKYNECKMSLDGKYLLPDNVFLAPNKESNVFLFSEFIDKWNNYTSVTSESFKLGIDINKEKFGISGSFSSEYRTNKRRQIEQKSSMFRVQARFNVYAVEMSTIVLDDTFKARIESAAEALQANDTIKTDYILELIVRDYGTDLITRIDAGSILVKEDFISRKFIENYNDDISVVKAAASASFNKVFKFDASYNQSSNQSVLEGYMRSMTSSHILTYGGSFFRPNSSVNEWIDSILNNFVAIDRIGVPLHYVINPETFPFISLKILDTLRTELKEAVSHYYSLNEHQGCLSMFSPNFDYTANVDSNQCNDSLNNYSFGGVFQECDGDQCEAQNLEIKNLLTGELSCPFNYSKTFLKSGTIYKWNSKTGKKDGCWFYDCDETIQWLSGTKYTAYWCAAMGDMPKNTRVMFGGVYNNKIDNLVTGGKSCPPMFIDNKILQDLHVCIGTDHELGYRYSVNFGGFFSCQSGNPFYSQLKSIPFILNNQDISKLENKYVLECPSSYSQHPAVIDQDCLVNYCVKENSFKYEEEMMVILPPFNNFHALFNNTKPIKIQDSMPDHKISPINYTVIIICSYLAGIISLFIVKHVILMIKMKSRQRYTPIV